MIDDCGWSPEVDAQFTLQAECAICYTVGLCYNDGEAYICVDRDACKARKAPYADCLHCPLRHEPCVRPYDPRDPTLLVVGEAPGYHEAKAGQPFVGPSGQLLDAVFNHVGISTIDVYKTNAVLCRPPANDLSKYPEALTACSARLRAELEQYPTIDIVALGGSATTALDALSGHSAQDGILKRRGHWYPFGNRHYLATLHPAFVLRSAGYVTQLLADMRSTTFDRTDAHDWLSTAYTVVNETTHKVFTAWLAQAVSDQRPVAFDVETANLDPRSGLLAIGLTDTLDGAWIVPGDLVRAGGDLVELLKRFFDRATLVAHNGKFDQHVLAANGLGRFDLSYDTMLAHYALDEQKGTHGLKQLATSLLGVPDYEAELIDPTFKGTIERAVRDYSKIPLTQLYRYLAIDCCVTLALAQTLDPLLDADQVREAYQIALDASNALQYVEHYGIKIDRSYLQQVLTHLQHAIAEAESRVQNEAREYVLNYLIAFDANEKWINPAPKWIKGTKKHSPREQYRAVLTKIAECVNLSSWQQMQVLLYDVLALKHTKKISFRTDPRSTNEEALNALPDHPFVTSLQAYRTLDKMRGTYVEPLLRLADSNDRVHIKFNIHGTETGRLSAEDGLHGIPRPSDIWGRALRGSFIADEGYTIVIADYSQAELRAFAAESKEPFLLNAYNNDEDVHGNTCLALFPDDPVVSTVEYDTLTGTWVWSKPNLDWLEQVHKLSYQDVKDHWKELRTLAKNTNFGGLVYLGGPEGIAAMLGGKLTATQLRPILARLIAQMPTARAWQVEQFRKALNQGFVQSRFGNKRRFPLITDDNREEVRKASVNAPIQNSASQLTLLAAIELIRKGFRVLHLVHDSIIIEAPNALVTHVATVTRETMERIGTKYFQEVKWKADIEVGARWYDNPPSFDKEPE